MRRRTLLKAVAAAPILLPAAAMQPAGATPAPASASGLSRYVFAHYMVAWPRGGPNAGVEDYALEIHDAMQRGIDGFALNCGGWSVHEPQYKARVLQIYEAAERFAGAFRLFVSADGHARDELADIVHTTRGLAAQLMQNGKPVLSAYGLGGRDIVRADALMRDAQKLGAWFIPHFSPTTGEAVIGANQASEIATRIAGADGYFFFGAAAAPDSLARSIALLSTALKRAGKTFMAPVTPYYRGLSTGTNYRAFETDGFSGMAKEWRAAIAAGANWIQIVTWNDWAESSYVAPIGSSSRAQIYNPRFGSLLSHTGYLDASRHFIRWFKSGVEPVIERDELYYFYRLHPVDVQTNLLRAFTDHAAFPPKANAALTALVHVTAFLKQAATLEITCGDTRRVVELNAGVNEIAVPSAPGVPHFSLIRHGAAVLQKSGELAITSNDYSGAFNYFSGSLSDAGASQSNR
ncbi:glycoside hydrolase family 71 protein [Paraburkholderia sp. BCC1886]|uniref:glycoside hydrolase family 71 protein n=1 Tax=Paraburkholderia sp. BCC1886 TaxID=2562670 RepID=UPI001183B1E4|nr:glycoside hydrolase family 71 protein [Paraburkholderia sp. BCC1886]